jgi:hypothetical protein
MELNVEQQMNNSLAKFSIEWGNNFDDPITWEEASYGVLQHESENVYLFINQDNVITHLMELDDESGIYVIADFRYGLYEDPSVSSVSDWDMWYSSCAIDTSPLFRKKLNGNLKRLMAHGAKKAPAHTQNFSLKKAMSSLFGKFNTPSVKASSSFVQEKSAVALKIQTFARAMINSPLNLKTDA